MTNDIETYGADNPLFLNNVVSCIGGREENQDSCSISETRRGLLVIVCDGMGGMTGGAIASAEAVKVIRDYVSKPVSEDDIEDDNKSTLIQAVSSANAALLAIQENNPGLRGMGTTVTALLINEEKATVAYVGDSRIYQIRKGRKIFRTFDHSMVFEMVKKKIITEEQARLSAQSNIILRAVGLKPDLDVDAFDLPYDKGDLFLLCTDGVWGTMSEKDLIKRVSERQHPKVVTETLAMNIHNDALRAGGKHDNLTAALVKTTKDSKLRSKMEDKIKKAFCVCLILLIVSVVANVTLCCKLRRVTKEEKTPIEKVDGTVEKLDSTKSKRVPNQG